MPKTLQLSLIVFILTLGALGLSFTDDFTTNYWTAGSFILFSISAAYLVYSTRQMRNQATEESSAGSYGVIGSVGLLALTTSGLAATASVNESPTATIMLCFATVGILLGGQYVLRFSADHLNLTSATKAYSSAHAQWGDRLETLALECKDEASRQIIMKSRERCRFLGRDGPSGTPENNAINTLIDELEASVRSCSHKEVMGKCEQLNDLFDRRETSLKRQRSKV